MRITLGAPLLLSEIARVTNGNLCCEDDALIKHITTDTRELCEGDLFAAIKGKQFDGENFTREAREKKAFLLSTINTVADILVDNTVDALLSLAEFSNKNLPIILYRVGITGSVGKSTTKDFLSILLSESFSVHKTDGNKNNEIGMPLTVLSAPLNCEAMVIEMGMNHLFEIERMSECLRPNLGIITNIGRAHIGNLGSRENIAKAKRELLKGMDTGTVIVPHDEPLLHSIENKITFSLRNKDADFFLGEEPDGSITIYQNQNLICQEKFALCENHFKECLISACAVATLCGLSGEEIKKGISRISRENIRQFEVFRENILFYADFYNSSPESLIAGIEGIQRLYPKKKKSLLLGDMLELGTSSADIHREIGKSIPIVSFENLFLFGKDAKEIGIGAYEMGFDSKKIFVNTNITAPEVTARQIRENCLAGEVVLMKASRGVMLERVLDLFSDE